jgi:hypothetical protein
MLNCEWKNMLNCESKRMLNCEWKNMLNCEWKNMLNCEWKNMLNCEWKNMREYACSHARVCVLTCASINYTTTQFQGGPRTFSNQHNEFSLFKSHKLIQHQCNTNIVPHLAHLLVARSSASGK